MNANDKDFWLNFGKEALAFLLFIGYYAMVLTAMFHGIPSENVQFVVGAITGLGPIIGLVAANMFPKGSEKDKDTIQQLTQKIPPVDTSNDHNV